jgi:hypothetical protein
MPSDREVTGDTICAQIPSELLEPADVELEDQGEAEEHRVRPANDVEHRRGVGLEIHQLHAVPLSGQRCREISDPEVALTLEAHEHNRPARVPLAAADLRERRRGR